MIKYITEEEILLAHFQLIENYGGSHGIRDLKPIKSVVLAARQEVFGVDQYPSIYEKAAVYARNIIADHPFTDGNKRTAITVAILFLERNGKLFTSKDGELEDFAVRIATDKLSIGSIADWLKKHSKKDK